MEKDNRAIRYRVYPTEKQHRIKCSRLQIQETSWSKRLWDGKSYEIRQQPLQRYTLQRLLCI
jgi:hypothetical protein